MCHQALTKPELVLRIITHTILTTHGILSDTKKHETPTSQRWERIKSKPVKAKIGVNERKASPAKHTIQAVTNKPTFDNTREHFLSNLLDHVK